MDVHTYYHRYMDVYMYIYIYTHTHTHTKQTHTQIKLKTNRNNSPAVVLILQLLTLLIQSLQSLSLRLSDDSPGLARSHGESTQKCMAGILAVALVTIQAPINNKLRNS